MITKFQATCFSLVANAITFGCYSLVPTIIHEMGHTLAMKALFRDADPHIELSPGFGASTFWNGEGITPTGVGEIFTQEQRRGLVSAAGPIADLGINILMPLVASIRTKDKIKKVLLRLYAANTVMDMWNYCNDVAYPNNDYVKVSEYLSIPHSTMKKGIMLVGMVTLLLSVQAQLAWWDDEQEENNNTL